MDKTFWSLALSLRLAPEPNRWVFSAATAEVLGDHDSTQIEDYRHDWNWDGD
jgi:hypothetical protein